MEILEWTYQLLTCKLIFENSISGSGCGTCKLNFENRNSSMEIWEWTSQQLTCKLNFEKFLFGYLEVVVVPAN